MAIKYAILLHFSGFTSRIDKNKWWNFVNLWDRSLVKLAGIINLVKWLWFIDNSWLIKETVNDKTIILYKFGYFPFISKDRAKNED